MNVPKRLAAWSAAALTSWAAMQAAAAPDDPRAPTATVTKPPRLLRFVEAPYPEAERGRGQGTAVVLALSIDGEGKVVEATVVESGGEAFDAAALEAAKRFEFAPAEIDGVKSPVRIQYRYVFELDDAAQKAPANEASFTGIVRDRKTGKPLPSVTVGLGDHTATTDENGRFRFESVAPGNHSVTLSGAELTPVGTEETIAAGQKYEATYDVEPRAATESGERAVDFEIVVVDTAFDKAVVATTVSAEQGARVAGTGGDVLKVVENMPGVARATAGSGAVVVWGASPADTRVYVDGVRVPLLYHFGGLRSVVHADLVNSVELVAGGYGATYGRGLGGLVVVEKKAPDGEELHGSAEANLLDASAALQGPLAGKWRIQGAARRSHLAWLVDNTTSKDSGEFFSIPQYHDAQASIRYQAEKDEYVEVGGLLSSDAVSRTAWSPDPTLRKQTTQELSFERVYARYEKVRENGSRVSVVPWVGPDRSKLSAVFGGVPTELDVHSMNYGLRASHRGPVTSFLTATVGFDLEGTSSEVRRSGSIASPPREGDRYVFGQAPSDQVNSDTWTAVVGSAAPYVEGDFAALSNRLHIVPGLRLEPLLSSVSRRTPTVGDNASVGAYVGDLSVQPRLSVRFALTDRVSFKAAYGRYRQPPLVEDLSPVYGNPLLQPPAATHALAGVSVRIADLLTAETTVFSTSSDGLAVRSPAPSPIVAQALVDSGQGRSLGMQVLVRRDLSNGFFGWVAYTLLRAERRDGPDAVWRLFDFDQTHVLTALASYELGKGFDIGTRFRYATGFPRTPVLGGYYDARRDLYDPILGNRNAERIPAFRQLDVRVSKTWKIASTKLEAYLDVQNVTNHENAEEIVYSADYRAKRYIHGLPILPIAGARWSF